MGFICCDARTRTAMEMCLLPLVGMCLKEERQAYMQHLCVINNSKASLLKSYVSGRAIMSVPISSEGNISKYRNLKGGALSERGKDKDRKAVILKPKGFNT